MAGRSDNAPGWRRPRWKGGTRQRGRGRRGGRGWGGPCAAGWPHGRPGRRASEERGRHERESAPPLQSRATSGTRKRGGVRLAWTCGEGCSGGPGGGVHRCGAVGEVLRLVRRAAANPRRVSRAACYCVVVTAGSRSTRAAARGAARGWRAGRWRKEDSATGVSDGAYALTRPAHSECRCRAKERVVCVCMYVCMSTVLCM